MNQTKEVHTMYWVTHPAFSLPWAKGTNVEEKTIEKFFSQVLNNLVKNIQADPNAVLVLVRSPQLKGAIKNGTASKEGIKLIEKFENEFESFSKRMLKERFISFRDTKADTVRASAFVDLKLRQRGFKILSKTKVVGAGSFLSACAKYYPLTFIEKNHPIGKKILLKFKKEFDALTIKSNLSFETNEKLLKRKNAALFRFFRVPESMNIEFPLRNKQAGFAPRKIKSIFK